MRKLIVIGIILITIALSPDAFAGPPFFTDDPVPVEPHHWEIYFASQYVKTADNRSGSAPLIDMNYGVVPNVHLHMSFWGAFNRLEGGPTLYGYGDTEFGAKIRFLQETDIRPQMAIYPTVDAPTGNADRGLGNGHTQAFLPLWIQKSWGPWAIYGGAGYWINPGNDHKNWVYTGWVLQRDLSKRLTLGAEIFHRTPDVVDTETGTGFTAGGQFNFNDNYHLLLAIGRDFSGPNQITQYLALQWTFE